MIEEPEDRCPICYWPNGTHAASIHYPRPYVCGGEEREIIPLLPEDDAAA
jgi:hypothetical protein